MFFSEVYRQGQPAGFSASRVSAEPKQGAESPGDSQPGPQRHVLCRTAPASGPEPRSRRGSLAGSRRSLDKRPPTPNRREWGGGRVKCLRLRVIGFMV